MNQTSSDSTTPQLKSSVTDPGLSIFLFIATENPISEPTTIAKAEMLNDASRSQSIVSFFRKKLSSIRMTK